MGKSAPLLLRNNCSSVNVTYPEFAKTKLSEEKILWIEEMRKLVVEHDLDSITQADTSLEYLRLKAGQGDQMESYTGKIGNRLIHVRKHSIFWTGYFGVEVRSESIEHTTLKQILEMLRMNLDEMPKYINASHPIARSLAEKRLREGE